MLRLCCLRGAFHPSGIRSEAGLELDTCEMQSWITPAVTLPHTSTHLTVWCAYQYLQLARRCPWKVKECQLLVKRVAQYVAHPCRCLSCSHGRLSGSYIRMTPISTWTQIPDHIGIHCRSEKLCISETASLNFFFLLLQLEVTWLKLQPILAA